MVEGQGGFSEAEQPRNVERPTLFRADNLVTELHTTGAVTVPEGTVAHAFRVLVKTGENDERKYYDLGRATLGQEIFAVPNATAEVGQDIPSAASMRIVGVTQEFKDIEQKFAPSYQRFAEDMRAARMNIREALGRPMDDEQQKAHMLEAERSEKAVLERHPEVATFILQRQAEKAKISQELIRTTKAEKQAADLGFNPEDVVEAEFVIATDKKAKL